MKGFCELSGSQNVAYEHTVAMNGLTQTMVLSHESSYLFRILIYSGIEGILWTFGFSKRGDERAHTDILSYVHRIRISILDISLNGGNLMNVRVY